jgi:hypothetical protein
LQASWPRAEPLLSWSRIDQLTDPLPCNVHIGTWMWLGSSQLRALKVLGWDIRVLYVCTTSLRRPNTRLSWGHTNRPDFTGPRPEPAEASARASSSCRLSRRGLLEMNSRPFGWLCRKTTLLLRAKVPPAHSGPQISSDRSSNAMFIETEG